MYNIAVVGAGISGITTAYTIKEHLGPSVHVTIFTENESPNTTSDIAAGAITPYIWGTMTEEESIKWTRATVKFLSELWKAGYAEEAGVSVVPMVKLTCNDEFNVEVIVKSTLGSMYLNREQLKRYGRDHNKNLKNGVHYVTFTCESSKFIPFLRKRVIQCGTVIKRCRISNFDELQEFDVIVNCSGLDSMKLALDGRVEPIRGQITRMKAPWIFSGLTCGANYVYPNMETTVLGGVEQHGNYNLEVDEIDKESITNACYSLLPQLKNAEILAHRVGLRPGRDKVRVASEIKKSGGRILKIVHNYGHCGNGITLSIGCAIDAAKLVENMLNLNKSKL